MTLFDQLQRALTAEGVEGALEHVLLTVRLQTKDTVHVAIRRAPSDAEAVEWLETEGRRYIEPYAVARVEGDHRPVQRPPLHVIESSEKVAGIGEGAWLWRGYANNTRGVVKFRRGRFVSEVNAPSVDEATAVAKGLSALLS